MKLNKAGKDLITQFEGGHKLTAYVCPAGVNTISVGLTRIYNRPVNLTDRLTLEESVRLFDLELNRFEEIVRNLLRVRLNENQFSALVSLCFNIGGTALRNSTLLRLVNENPTNPEIRNQFLRWNKANGRVLNGLTRRRTAEANLYFS